MFLNSFAEHLLYALAIAIILLIVCLIGASMEDQKKQASISHMLDFDGDKISPIECGHCGWTSASGKEHLS